MIQVVNRALDIIEFIAIDQNKPKQLGEISKTLLLNNGTCANIIKTLVNRGYLEKISNQGGYILGNQLYNLVELETDVKHLISIAEPFMQKATEQLNENTLLAVIKGDKRTVCMLGFLS
jgi:DNA-binding IclR family transcriptional regulator